MENIELNCNRQYILAGDISASMNQKDHECAGLSRYNYMLEKFKSFIKSAEDFDADGVTVITYGENVKVYRNTTLDNVDKYLDNPNFEGFTNTHLVVEEAYNLHREEKRELKKTDNKHPGTVLFIFTDGEPTNQAALERVIVKIANEVESDDEFSIGFLTVGTISKELNQYLEKLDDGLKNKTKYDIVGVKKLENVTFLQAVNNAINE